MFVFLFSFVVFLFAALFVVDMGESRLESPTRIDHFDLGRDSHVRKKPPLSFRQRDIKYNMTLQAYPFLSRIWSCRSSWYLPGAFYHQGVENVAFPKGSL